MQRVYRSLAWLLGVPIAACAVLVAVALWAHHQREAEFPGLPPGERQLAIFDAFARNVSAHYYDRRFIATEWPALRDEWRSKAAQTRDDVALYYEVLQQLQQKFPSSHVSAVAPPDLLAKPSTGVESRKSEALPDRGFELNMVRRGTQVRGFVGDIRPGTPAAAAGIEPGWQIVELPDGDGPMETGVFIDTGPPLRRFEYETGLGWERPISDDWKTSGAVFSAQNMRRVEFRHVAQERFTALSVQKLDDGVSHIRLGTFEHAPAIDLALEALDEAGDGGVVLDMRVNGGGFVEQEMRLLDRLLPEKLLVGRRVGVERTVDSHTGAGKKYSGPLVVLIGPGTASAAECVAAALQDHGRAPLLGRSTAGAVLTANTWPLPDGGGVVIAYQDFLRANGKRIEGIGVLPDIPVMQTNADVRAGRDPALERALQELRSARATAAAGNPPPPA